MTTPSKGPGNPLRALVFCPAFCSDQWQLPLADTFGERVLIGWRTQGLTVEGGAPPSLAHLFAKAFCRHGTVTFAKGLRPPAGAGLLPRRWKLDRNFVWFSTRDENEAAAGIFADDIFSWDRQGQIVVLSAAESIPALDERHLPAPGDPAVVRAIRDLGARAVFLPGADGAVAGLYAFEAPYGVTLRNGLAEAAKEIGIEVEVVNERAFAHSLTR